MNDKEFSRRMDMGKQEPRDPKNWPLKSLFEYFQNSMGNAGERAVSDEKADQVKAELTSRMSLFDGVAREEYYRKYGLSEIEKQTIDRWCLTKLAGRG